MAERARVLGEGAAHPHRHAGDHGLRRVARPRHLVRGVPQPLVALEAHGQAAEDRFRLSARGAGVRPRAHRVVPGLGERGGAPLVRHPVVHLREVALHAHARPPRAEAGRLVAQVRAVGVVPQGVHHQVRVEHRPRVLAGVGDVELMARGGLPDDAAPGGADREGPIALVLGPVVGELGEAPAVAVLERVAPALRVPREGREPLAAATEGERGVDEAEGAGGEVGRRVPPRLRLAGDHVDGPAEPALVLDVERPLADLDAVHLREVHVEGGRVHVVRARPVDALAVDQHVQVAALQAAQHDLVRDPALAQPPQSGLPPQGLADVHGGHLAQLRRLERAARGLAHDAHRLPEARDLEREVERSLLAAAHDDPRDHALLEAGQRGPDLVGARRELGRAERPDAARREARARAPRLAREQQHDTGEARPVARRHLSRDAAAPVFRARSPTARPQASTKTIALMTPLPRARRRNLGRRGPESDALWDFRDRQAGRRRFGGGTGGARGRARGLPGATLRSSGRGSGRASRLAAGSTASNQGGAPATTASRCSQPQPRRRQGRSSAPAAASAQQQRPFAQQNAAGSSARTRPSTGRTSPPPRDGERQERDRRAGDPRHPPSAGGAPRAPSGPRARRGATARARHPRPRPPS